MHNLDLILTLAGGFTAALILGYFTQRLGLSPIVIEMNMDTVRQLRADGVDAVYGDATKRDTLEAARAAQAGTVILTSAGMHEAAEVIRMARELNPKVQVLARAAYLRDLADMQKAGADQVFTGEGEVALGRR